MHSLARVARLCRAVARPGATLGVSVAAVALAPAATSQEPAAPGVLRVILTENFDHTCQSCASGTAIELKPGITEDKRANPNDFVREIISPIIAAVMSRPDSMTVALGQVSWAAGLVKTSQRPVVDVGSSKCALLAPVGSAGKIVRTKAPPLTEPLVAAKVKDFGIDPEVADLSRAHYERLVPFLVRCWVEGATLVATEGVRAAAAQVGLPLQGLTVHSLLASARSPVREHYLRDADVLGPILSECHVSILTGTEEAMLEFADAAAKYADAPRPLAAGEKLLFVSMGGSSTQVVCIDAAGIMKNASFAVGKNYFRRDKAAKRACVAAMAQLLTFVEENL